MPRFSISGPNTAAGNAGKKLGEASPEKQIEMAKGVAFVLGIIALGLGLKKLRK
jgi:hypothetical protein